MDTIKNTILLVSDEAMPNDLHDEVPESFAISI